MDESPPTLILYLEKGLLRTMKLETNSFEGRRPRSRAGLLVGITLAAGAAVAVPAAAQPGNEICTGKRVVTRLAGPHAVTRRPVADIAALRSRLPELEASIRTAVGKDSSLGPAVAEALIEAIRSGSSITERPMQRTEQVQWMAYQPDPGRYDVITPACLRLDRGYEAFEITVEVADPVRAAPAPTCNIEVNRSCVASGSSFSVSTAGSSPGAKVTMTGAGGGSAPVTGSTVTDDQPYDTDATFTVRVQGAPAPANTARVYRFLMPKVCGNIAYLGEGPARTLAASATPQSCEKSVVVDRCAPALPGPVTGGGEDEIPVQSSSCADTWSVRGFGFGYFPLGSDQERDVIVPGNFPGDERFGVTNGFGIGGSVERRITDLIGIEAGLLVGRGSSDYEITLRNGQSESDSHDVNFYALTIGPNFHLARCSSVDVYVGPFIGYGGFGDPNYWAFDHHFNAAFDGDFIYGAQLGLDLPLRNGPWGFHTGLRWFRLDQSTDAGTLEVDPLIFELGFTYGF